MVVLLEHQRRLAQERLDAAAKEYPAATCRRPVARVQERPVTRVLADAHVRDVCIEDVLQQRARGVRKDRARSRPVVTAAYTRITRVFEVEFARARAKHRPFSFLYSMGEVTMRRRAMLAAGLALVLLRVSAAEKRRDNEEECARLDARLREIADQRRAGYTAKQGRRLQWKRDEIEQRRRLKCR